MEPRLTIREEANALTCWAFRHSYIEELHEGKYSEFLETPGLSRITNAEMKKLMIGISARMAEILELRESNPVEYWRQIIYFHENYCGEWEK